MQQMEIFNIDHSSKASNATFVGFLLKSHVEFVERTIKPHKMRKNGLRARMKRVWAHKSTLCSEKKPKNKNKRPLFRTSRLTYVVQSNSLSRLYGAHSRIDPVFEKSHSNAFSRLFSTPAPGSS